MDTGGTTGPAAAPYQLEPVSRRKLKRIRDQLEFYLGSANLSRDRFLQNNMCPPMSMQAPGATSCGCVALSVISQFAIMKELTGGSLELIRRGAELSSHLELSADRAGVRRRQPIALLSEEETAQRTIYVEHIPPKLSSHRCLKGFFSKYGSVTHMSLPQYRLKKGLREGKVTISSKLIAFIEFATQLSALAAISAFQGKYPVSPLTNETNEASKCETPKMCPIKFGKDLTNKSNSSDTNNRKRRCEDNQVEDTSDTCRGAKRKKGTFSPVPSLQAIDPPSEDIECSQMGRVKKKKVRKRRKPRKKKREINMLMDINSNCSNVSMQQMSVISKSDWLKNKSELKTVQREFMGHLKLVNRQAVLGTPINRLEYERKDEKMRGLDKILDQSMQIAEKIFKQK